MKILFLSHLDMNLYLFRLPIMQALVQEGHEVIALVPKGAYFDYFKEYKIKAISYHIQRASLNPLTEIKTIREIALKFKEIQPDIIHTFTIKPNIYGSLAAKIANISCVINSVTGLGSFYIEYSLKTFFLRLLIEVLNKIAFKIAKNVVFQNNDDLELYVNKKLLPSQKAILIKGSGVDIDYFSLQQVSQECQQEYKRQLGIPQDNIVVLMVARAIVHKGVKEYYAMAQNIKHKIHNVSFLYVGDTDKGNITAITHEFLQNKNVQWLGSRKDVREIIAIADIFVLPSYREGIPRTLLEAASMSKAIVTTNTIGCKEVVVHDYNGFLVPTQDINKLQEYTEKLIKNPSLCTEMGENGRKKVINEFSTKIIVAKHLELYNNIKALSI